MKRVVVFMAFGLQLWSTVTGYSAGAPVGRCVDMIPGHGVPPQSGASPYTIMISSTTFSTNQEIKVMVQGPVYAGLLLQARSGSNTDAVGTWGTPPPNTQHLACTGINQSAITHSNKNSKNNETTYTWIPSASLDSAFFTATVVANRTIFWVNVTSTRMTKAQGGGSSAAADPKMAVTPVVFLTLLMSMVFQ